MNLYTDIVIKFKDTTQAKPQNTLPTITLHKTVRTACETDRAVEVKPKRYKYFLSSDAVAKDDEVEVYRLTPRLDHYYFTATHTRRVGNYPNEKYFTKNDLEYVGKFLEHNSIGYHDNAQHWDLFEFGDDIKEIKRVDYTYEGTTSFVEFPTKEEAKKLLIYQSMQIIDFIKCLKQPKIILGELVKHAYSPQRLMYSMSFCENIEELFQ